MIFDAINAKPVSDVDFIELPTTLDFGFDSSFTTSFENLVCYLVIHKHSEERLAQL